MPDAILILNFFLNNERKNNMGIKMVHNKYLFNIREDSNGGRGE